LTPFDQKWQAAIKRFSFFGVSAKDNSKHWAMHRLSQLLVSALLSASILLYQFLKPSIGGKGQFLKESCHRGGPDRAALKGIFFGFGFNEVTMIRSSLKTEEIGC
jgi:hypothetical protein